MNGRRWGWMLMPRGQWLVLAIVAFFFTLGSCFGCLGGIVLARSLLR